MSQKHMPLGKGLAALLGDWQAPLDTHIPAAIQMIPIQDIEAGRFQVRQFFEDGSLAELAQSIQAQGLLQPITVRPKSQGYEIIAGERRWRACQLLAKTSIAAIVQDVSDETAMALGLLENLQREDLNPVEEALGLQRLCDEFSLTHQHIAELIGQSRAHVSNQLRLLQLEPEILNLLAKGKLSVGHARCLIGLETNAQIALAEKIQQFDWSVRTTEAQIQHLSAHKKSKTRALNSYQTLVDKLNKHWDSNFEIQTRPNHKGKIIIHYQNEAEFQKLLNHLLEEKTHD